MLKVPVDTEVHIPLIQFEGPERPLYFIYQNKRFPVRVESVIQMFDPLGNKAYRYTVRIGKHIRYLYREIDRPSYYLVIEETEAAK